ncbi:MAG: CsbD family protein [Rhodobacter sp.]|nr:CsbD family protein [Rhodobacter sp.]
MNWDTVEGTWKQLKGKAQTQWGKITSDEWDQIAGKREEIAGLIQKRYGQTKDEAERQVDNWFRDL